MNAAKEAFSAYLSDTNMDSRQIYFVNQIIEYIVHNGMLKDLSVLQESPFTDQGSIVDIFTDLSVWMGIRGVIDQINAKRSRIRVSQDFILQKIQTQERNNMDKHNYSAPVSLKNIQVTDTFWKGEMELVRKEVIRISGMP